METSIKLICQPFGHCVVPLDVPACSQQERDLESALKINTKKTWQHTNKQAKCLSTIFSQAQKLRNKGREVEIHSPLVCVANWSKLGELDLTSVWVTFLRKPLTVREGYGPTRVYCFRLS